MVRLYIVFCTDGCLIWRNEKAFGAWLNYGAWKTLGVPIEGATDMRQTWCIGPEAEALYSSREELEEIGQWGFVTPDRKGSPKDEIIIRVGMLELGHRLLQGYQRVTFVLGFQRNRSHEPPLWLMYGLRRFHWTGEIYWSQLSEATNIESCRLKSSLISDLPVEPIKSSSVLPDAS
jgi:hypothetical protein